MAKRVRDLNTRIKTRDAVRRKLNERSMGSAGLIVRLSGYRWRLKIGLVQCHGKLVGSDGCKTKQINVGADRRNVWELKDPDAKKEEYTLNGYSRQMHKCRSRLKFRRRYALLK